MKKTSLFENYMIIFYFWYNLKYMNAHQGVRYLKKIATWHDYEITFDADEVDIAHQYNPVDDEWRRKKCTSLGFTYRDPLMKRVLSSSTIPVNAKSNENLLYFSLSKVICHNRYIYQDLLKNIMNSIKTNPVIGELFDSKERFEYFMNEANVSEKPVIPIDQDVEKCVLCSEDSTLMLLNCMHPMCERCGEIHIDVLKNNSCPLCKSDIQSFTNLRGNVKTVNEYVELLGAAFYIDVCIYLYRTEYDDWILFHKNWPNYDNLDLKDEKCIYLYETEGSIGIVSYVT